MTAIIFMALAVIGLHEAGHVAAALSVGLNVRRFGISWKGFYIVREHGSPVANMYATLAGPGANLLIAIVFAPYAEFAHMNLMFGLLNLLPLSGSDGQRAWALFTRGVSRI